MPERKIRKCVVYLETIRHDGGAPADRPLRIGVATVVMENPFAGRYEADLMPFMNSLKPLAMDLSAAPGSTGRSIKRDRGVW